MSAYKVMGVSAANKKAGKMNVFARAPLNHIAESSISV